ncbi:ectoine hydroxylase [Cereibacter sp. SYSU M97828]|nr:ectoine hydroxylase [Cereibacter flavus]
MLDQTHDDYPTRLPQERWLERSDPTVWQSWTENAPLTRQQAEFFDANGYLVLEGMFSDAEVALLQKESASLRTGGGIAPENVITEPGSDEVRTVFRLDEQNALFARLAADERVAGKVRFLLDDDLYLHQSRLNYKPGFTGKEFYWHSDFETWHAEDGMPRMRAVSASVLLTDNSPLNGPLMLIPGSHKTFVACAGETPDNNHATSLKKQEIGVPSPESLSKMAEAHGIEYASGRAGTVILFDCNTLHGSNGNITPFPRSNAFFVYNAWSNRVGQPFAAKSPRPAFLSSRAPDAPIAITGGPLA